MRLLHPKTLIICAERKDIPKTVISHCWAECFKWKASGKPHPKMFIDNNFDLGRYLNYVEMCGREKGCNLDAEKIKKLGKEVFKGFMEGFNFAEEYFDDNYLFSDACSLYYKGINIFPDIFGDKWRKYVPVESLKEIKRQVDKTLSKEYIKIPKNYLKDFKI